MPGLRPSRWMFVLPFPDLTVGAISFRRFAAVFALSATHSNIGVAGEARSKGYYYLSVVKSVLASASRYYYQNSQTSPRPVYPSARVSVALVHRNRNNPTLRVGGDDAS
jgi:hypothetical protein